MAGKPSKNLAEAILKGSRAILQLISAGEMFHSFAAITANDFRNVLHRNLRIVCNTHCTSKLFPVPCLYVLNAQLKAL